MFTVVVPALFIHACEDGSSVGYLEYTVVTPAECTTFFNPWTTRSIFFDYWREIVVWGSECAGWMMTHGIQLSPLFWSLYYVVFWVVVEGSSGAHGIEVLIFNPRRLFFFQIWSQLFVILRGMHTIWSHEVPKIDLWTHAGDGILRTVTITSSGKCTPSLSLGNLWSPYQLCRACLLCGR